MLTMAFTANPVLAKDRHNFTDYARVVHVEPAYRYDTVKVPQKVCRPSYNTQKNNHTDRSHHRQHSNTQNYRSSQRYSTSTDSAGAVFIGGVIGGAIGHQVSRSVNGHSSAGATVAGAIIGSTLAHSASKSGQSHNNYSGNRPFTGSAQHNQSRNNHNRQQRRNLQYPTPRSHQRGSAPQHCTTTTQTRRERHKDGFNVTYIYKGQSFSTHTNRHPGKRIAVQVAISTGH